METYRQTKIINTITFTQKIKCFFGFHDNLKIIDTHYTFRGGDVFGLYKCNEKCLSCNKDIYYYCEDISEYADWFSNRNY